MAHQNVPFHIIRCVGTDQVLDIEQGECVAGAHVICYPRNDPPTPNQLWRLEDQGNGRCFVVSAADPNLVLDVEGSNGQDGTQLVVYDRSYPPTDNQLFMWQNGVIKSCMPGDFVVDAAVDPPYGFGDPMSANAVIWTFHGEGNQRWAIDYV